MHVIECSIRVIISPLHRRSHTFLYDPKIGMVLSVFVSLSSALQTGEPFYSSKTILLIFWNIDFWYYIKVGIKFLVFIPTLLWGETGNIIIFKRKLSICCSISGMGLGFGIQYEGHLQDWMVCLWPVMDCHSLCCTSLVDCGFTF